MMVKYKIFFIIFAIIFASEDIFPQPNSGDFEFSIAASYMSRKHETADESWIALIFPVRAGYFVYQNLEVEPELIISKLDNEDTGYILSANLGYHFNAIDSMNMFVPFVLAGIGVSNTLAFVPNLAWVGYNDEKRTILNAGAGLKIFMSDAAAIRLEYRYQQFMNEENIFYHNLLLGVSVFLF